MNLHQEAINLVKPLNTKESEELCAEIGVSLRWLYKFKNEEIEPSVVKCQKIYDKLSK
jgi:transcriptional regulator with XRE-family HTH domain